jgi:hypothetical protein
LLLIAIATGALSSYAGRDEIRHSGEAMWRSEAFLAYALFVGLVLTPMALYFYVFHGDWFLFYWVATHRAPWVWGFVSVALLLGAAFAGFSLGATLCRASRDSAARRFSVVAVISALAVWPAAWRRLSVVGSQRQFVRDYGLVPFESSAPFFSGAVMLLILCVAFGWLVYRIDRQTRDVV